MKKRRLLICAIYVDFRKIGQSTSFYVIYSPKEMRYHTYKYRKSSILLPNHEMTLIGQFTRKVTYIKF